MCCFAETTRLFRLEVRLTKTEVLHHHTPWADFHPPIITIGGTEMKAVKQITYLGCTISSDAKIDKEIDSKLLNASNVFDRLCQHVWNGNYMRKSKKSDYREPLFSLPYSIGLSRGLFNAVTCDFLSLSINFFFVSSSASNGETLSPVWIRQRLLASSPCC